MRYLVPGPAPCPEVVTVSYIRLVGVPTLSSVEGDAQVEQKNHEHRFLTVMVQNDQAAGSGPLYWGLYTIDKGFEAPL